MMATVRLRTLRSRLTFFYACVIALALTTFGGTVYGLMVLSEAGEQEPEEQKQAELAEVRRRMLGALAVALPLSLAVAAGGGAWIMRRALASLEQVAHITTTLGADNLHARVPAFRGAGTEVEQVAAALNEMLERLERAVLGLRRFTADAAHELRTPLAVLLGNLEIALRRPRDADSLRATLEDALEELRRLIHLVESLLTLARSDARELPQNPEPVDVADMAAQVISLYEQLALDRGIGLTLHGAASLRLHTDPLWLSRVLVNLVDNACKFTPPGGRVDVHVEPVTDGAQIHVEDTGPGIPAEDQARVFERFFRGARTRGQTAGFGLGLSLAHELAAGMGGTLTLSGRTDRKPGARFTLRLSEPGNAEGQAQQE